jgi:hypothetical protein
MFFRWAFAKHPHPHSHPYPHLVYLIKQIKRSLEYLLPVFKRVMLNDTKL